MNQPPNKNTFEKDLILAEREQKVVRSVALIQRAQYSLSLSEQRFLLYTISKVRPDDDENKEYEIELKDYMAVCGLQPTTSYGSVKELIMNVFKNMVLVIEDEGKFLVTGWYDFIECPLYDGTIRYKFGSKVSKHLIGLAKYNATAKKENRVYYVSDELKWMAPFVSRYSYYLYPLLRSYGNKNEWIFPMEELRERLDAYEHPDDVKAAYEAQLKENQKRVPLYSRFYDFRKNVLDTAVDDINKFSNIKCAYRPLTKGRKIVAIEFVFEEKTLKELNDADARRAAYLDKETDQVPKLPEPLPFYEANSAGEDTVPPSVYISHKQQIEMKKEEPSTATLAGLRQYIDKINRERAQRQLENVNLGKHGARKSKNKEEEKPE